MRQRWLSVAMLAVVLLIGSGGGSTRAQAGIPNGVFVQDSQGWIWLVLDSQRVNVPVWQATDFEIAALPKSDRWAVANESGAIIGGPPPPWLQPGGDAPLTGQHPPQPVQQANPPASAPPPARELIPNVAGQQTRASYGADATFQATVVEMFRTRSLPAVKAPLGGEFPSVAPTGLFVIVLADVENIGRKPTCCLPGFRLQDARGRFFTGEVNQADNKVEQATLAFYHPTIQRDLDDYQPNLPKRRVFVYDVPIDAAWFWLSPDR